MLLIWILLCIGGVSFVVNFCIMPYNRNVEGLLQLINQLIKSFMTLVYRGYAWCLATNLEVVSSIPVSATTSRCIYQPPSQLRLWKGTSDSSDNNDRRSVELATLSCWYVVRLTLAACFTLYINKESVFGLEKQTVSHTQEIRNSPSKFVICRKNY